MCFGDVEVLDQGVVIDSAFDVGDDNSHAVLLTTVWDLFAVGVFGSLAVCVGDVVFESLDLSGQCLYLTVENCECVDVVAKALDSCEGLDGCLNCCHDHFLLVKPANVAVKEF